jgi:D-sedoheptulose 7-phosphate isomerase
MQHRLNAYFDTLGRLPLNALASDANGVSIPLAAFFETVVAVAHDTHDNGSKLMFVGNGGSAAIASHMAIDFSKNAGLRACAFNDGAALTCLGNDLGYENVFARQIDLHACAGDLLVAISSSGNSANIVAAVAAARARGANVVTFSGFAPDNRLRGLGDYNLYVPSSEYGFVEVTHLALAHALLDLAMGWGAEAEPAVAVGANP